MMPRIENPATTSINVPANSLITVPTTVAGTATILVTTNIALASGILTTLPTAQFMAGSPSVTGPPVDGTGTSAVFWGGGHLAVNSAGTVMVSDGGALRQVTQAGAVTTLALTGFPAGLHPCRPAGRDYYQRDGGVCLQLEYVP